jgi:hypothetical protein
VEETEAMSMKNGQRRERQREEKQPFFFFLVRRHEFDFPSLPFLSLPLQSSLAMSSDDEQYDDDISYEEASSEP